MLSHTVLLQVIETFAGVVALLTGKGFLTSVRKHVILHIIGLNARVAALLACKELYSSVCEHV